ncbi:MAG TPA: hypothetical protein VD833_09150 [Vicinamibacterales bacterium]|nr:hypothetical protein [Vicinamibacterales bacterium]
MKRALVVGLLAVTAAACSTTRAHVRVEEAPPLEVPPVPARVIEPAPPAQPPVLEPVPDLPSSTTTEPPRRPATAKERAGTDPKPESKPESPPDASAANPPPPVPPLRTAASPEPEVAQQQVRDVLDRARKILDTIHYQGLSQERRDNYEAVKGFITEAEAALKAGNIVQAKALADRAETTAKALGGRSGK